MHNTGKPGDHIVTNATGNGWPECWPLGFQGLCIKIKRYNIRTNFNIKYPYKEKPQRIDTQNVARFLTFGTYRRQHLFRDPNLCQLFLDTLHRQSEEDGFDIWAYVIMSNHVHLLLFPHENVSIRKVIAKFKRRFSHFAIEYLENKNQNFIKQLQYEDKGITKTRIFQYGGGYDRDLWTAQELLKTVKYIHNNPVRAGITEDELVYKWSSAYAWEEGDEKNNILDLTYFPVI